MKALELAKIFYDFEELPSVAFNEPTFTETIEMEELYLATNADVATARLTTFMSRVEENFKNGFIVIQHDDLGLCYQGINGVYRDILTFAKLGNPEKIKLKPKYPSGKPTIADHLKLNLLA